MMVTGISRRVQRLTRGGLGDLLVAQVASVASSVVVTFATAFFMGPELRGVVAYVLSLGNLLGVVAFQSFHVGTVRAEQRGEAHVRRAGLRATVASAGVLTLVGIIGAAIAWALGNDAARETLLATVGGALVCVTFFLLRLGQALGHDAQFRNASLIQGVGFAVVGSLLAATIKQPEPVIGAWLVCLVASTLYMLRVIDWGAPTSDRPPSLRRLLRESWSAHVATLGVQVLYRLNVVALGLFATRSEAGLYSVAAPIAECTWLLSEAVSLIAFRHAVRESRPHRRMALGHFGVTFIGGLGVAASAWILLPVVLPEFTDARVLVLVLLPGVLAQGAARVALAGLIGRDPGRRAIIIGVVSALAAVLYVPAALIGGALGVAVVSSTLYCLLGVAVITSDRLSRPTESETK